MTSPSKDTGVPPLSRARMTQIVGNAIDQHRDARLDMASPNEAWPVERRRTALEAASAHLSSVIERAAFLHDVGCVGHSSRERVDNDARLPASKLLSLLGAATKQLHEDTLALRDSETPLIRRNMTCAADAARNHLHHWIRVSIVRLMLEKLPYDSIKAITDSLLSLALRETLV